MSINDEVSPLYSNLTNFVRCKLEQLSNTESSYFTKLVADRAHLVVKLLKKYADDTAAFYKSHSQLSKGFNDILLSLNATGNTDSSRSIDCIRRDVEYDAGLIKSS